MTLDQSPDALSPEGGETSFDAEVERLQKMRALAQKLAAKRDECVRTKSAVEQRWIRSLRQYYGISGDCGTKDGPQSSGEGQAPKPHMTRSRADRWEARLCDMLFPANDLPWDLTPTPENFDGSLSAATPQAAAQPQFGAMPMVDVPAPPDPELMRQLEDDKAARMKRTIQDQLRNCKFSRSGRRMIQDAVRIGTGLMMGPMRGISTKRKFRSNGGVMTLEVEETMVPEIREADPWCYFPDMVASTEKAESAFYLHLLSPLEVRNLAPGFDTKQIAALLKSNNGKPDLGEVAKNIAARNKGLNHHEPMTNRYAVWRYTGTLDAAELAVLGCTCESDEGTEEGEPDELPPMAMADLWFCQDFILRAKLSPIQNDFRIPYYVFSPFPADDTPFGLSIPELCEDSQRVAESAWLIALHNASVSSGPLFISRAGALRPRDGSYVIRGPKWMEVTDPNVDMKEALSVHQIPNMVEQALMIFDRAMDIMDEELNTSQWASQPNAEEVPTASGLAMLLNIRSILQVRVATAADDEIFGPIIERMYWFNMLYNPDDSIKGDYTVAPLVQSVRLVKDIQVQHLHTFTAMSESPRFAPYIDDYALLKSNAAMLDFPTEHLILSREKAEEKIKQRGPDPQALLVQAKAESEQARGMLLQVQAEAEKQRLQFEPILARMKAQAQQADAARELHKDNLEIAGKQIEHEEEMRALDIREGEVQARERIALIKEQTARLELEQKRLESGLRLQSEERARDVDVKARLAVKGMDVESAAQELAFKARTGQPGI